MNKSTELLNSSAILKFSIENLLNDVDSIRNFESKKSRKKIYEYFQDEGEIELKAMGPLASNISNLNFLSDSIQDDLKKEKNHTSSNESSPLISGPKSKSFIYKKRSLDTCLNSLMKLSSSSSFEK